MSLEATDGLDVARIGKMFVTNVTFTWNDASQTYNQKTQKYDKKPGYWNISATLADKPERYGHSESMSIKIEQGVGQKLAEVLLPVVVVEAGKKAQQLADDSKAMIAALGDRTQLCITDMPAGN